MTNDNKTSITFRIESNIKELMDKNCVQRGITISQYLREIIVADLNHVKDTQTTDGNAVWGKEPEGFVL